MKKTIAEMRSLVFGDHSEKRYRAIPALGLALLVCISGSRVVLSEEPDEISFKNDQALDLMVTGREKDAVAIFESILAEDPDNCLALYNLSGYYLAKGTPRKAIPLMEHAVFSQPEDSAFRVRLSESYAQAGMKDKAIEQYEAVVVQHPLDANAHVDLAELYASTGRLAKAEETLKRASRQLNNNPYILSNLGRVMVLRENYREAIEVLKIAEKLYDCPYNAMSMSMALEGLGQFEKAEDYLIKAKTLGARKADTETHLARVRAKAFSGKPSRPMSSNYTHSE